MIPSEAARAADERERDLQVTLRQRLLVAASLFVGFYGLLSLISLRAVVAPGALPTAVRLLLAQWGVTAVIGAIALVVWRGRDLSVRALRVAELGIFVAGTGFLAVAAAFAAQQHGWFKLPEGHVGHPFFTDTGTRLDPLTLRWFAVITGYGLLIPNTGRRCATVVGVMSLTYLGLLVVQGRANGASGGAVASMLIYPSVWMSVAWVAAAFGAHRLGVLQRQVYDARRLGQYRLQRRLGIGGMGEVWLAEHVLLRQTRAVKIVRPEGTGRQDTLARFEREVMATARIQHPNVVQIYDYGRAANGTFYYVMEYLPGINLDDLVERYGALPPGRAIYLLRQVCGALGAAHAIGLVHRDVKPENVIVGRHDNGFDMVKLLDFGLVKDVRPDARDARLTQSDVLTGTPAFMAPEQITNGKLDARSDIYGVGCLAFLLLTGRPPFGDQPPLALAAAHLHETPVAPSHERPGPSPELDAVVLRCLAKARENRFPDVASLEQALSECPEAGAWTELEATAWWARHASAADGSPTA
jgi:tRNA A-37 threonylcarbamoyl transferase component Bud32